MKTTEQASLMENKNNNFMQQMSRNNNNQKKITTTVTPVKGFLNMQQFKAFHIGFLFAAIYMYIFSTRCHFSLIFLLQSFFILSYHLLLSPATFLSLFLSLFIVIYTQFFYKFCINADRKLIIILMSLNGGDGIVAKRLNKTEN